MNKKYVLVEHVSAINTIIHNTFRSTQRIKFTSFDVSTKYIIFGVNSGGIYIFSRESCQFVKLIPSTHGPANLLLISEDETNLAVAVSTGSVVVLEDCFGANFQQQIFSEHEGSTVTALKWNDNDLYCGDSTGKVSVITIKNFLTKAMFQTPVACLMHLDSQVVQLDTHSKFLLVSTVTRSLLCDTETERYRQIGKKSRDGPFGACFFDVAESLERSGAAPQTRSAFQTVGDNEQLSLNKTEGDVKIYCARPGARLWQADFQADVIFTHQFRPSLNTKQSDLLHWDDAPDVGLKIVKHDDGVRVGENFNFGKIFAFANKFILTFREDGVYIFEPSASALVFWRRFDNVKDVKIVNSFIYVWHRDLEISILSLFSVEELILKSLFNKQYLLCGQLCAQFSEEVRSLIDTSKKIHLISALESKLDNKEVLDEISPIIQCLKDYARTPILEKLKNGIVSVNNIASIKPPEPVEQVQSEKPERKEFKDILLEQYKISNIHKNVETSDFCRMMKSLNANEFYSLVNCFSKQSPTESESRDLWCKEVYLKYLKITQNFDFELDALNYACAAFLDLNSSEHLACTCNYPLPKASRNSPKYYEIGCILLDKTCSHDIFQKRVPYIHRFFLESLEGVEQVQSKLPLIIQYSDPKTIKNLSNNMPYDVWDDSIRLLFKLKSGRCLNCGKEIDTSESLEWKSFGLLMVQSIQAANALKLFKRHVNLLPQGTLDEFFYQYCIFSTVSGINSNVFNDILNDESVKRQLETSVGEYLRKKSCHEGEYDRASGNKSSEMTSNCDHCQLPLKMPLVEEERLLNCRHRYHQVCFLYNKKRCTVCYPVL